MGQGLVGERGAQVPLFGKPQIIYLELLKLRSSVLNGHLEARFL